MRIYIVGSLNMDLVIRAPRVPEGGETISGEGFMTNPGGRAPIRPWPWQSSGVNPIWSAVSDGNSAAN